MTVKTIVKEQKITKMSKVDFSKVSNMNLKPNKLHKIPTCTLKEINNGSQYAMVGIAIVNVLPLEHMFL